MLFVLAIEVCVKTLLRQISMWMGLNRSSYVLHAVLLSTAQTNNSTGLSRKKSQIVYTWPLETVSRNFFKKTVWRKKKKKWNEMVVVVVERHLDLMHVYLAE